MKYILALSLILFGFLSYSQTGWVPSKDSTEDNSYYQEPISKLDTFKYVYNYNYQDTIPKTQYREVNGVKTGFIPNLRKTSQAVKMPDDGPIYNVVHEYYGQYFPNPGRTWVGWSGQ